MRKNLFFLLLTILIMAVLSVPSFAAKGRHAGSDLAKITDYALSGKMASKSNNGRNSLGAYAADGTSPGEIIGRSWRDDQSHLSPGHFTGWRGTSTPQIHFAFGAQACEGYTNPNTCARWLHSNMYEPITGVWVSGANGIPLQILPFTEGGAFAQAEVDETGHIVVIGEVMNSGEGEDAVNGIKMFWDVSPTSIWGTILPDTLPYQQTKASDLWYRQPRMAYQEYGGKYITHVVSLDDYGFGGTNSTREMWYFRREANNTGPTDVGDGDTWTSFVVTDSIWSNSYALGVSPDGDGVACLVWVGYYGQGGDAAIWVTRSTNAGETWDTKVNIVPFGDEWQPWVEVDAMVDSEGGTHVIYPAGGVDPMRIFHWTDRIDDGLEGGKRSLIDALDFNGLEDMCGRFGFNLFSAGKQMLSECNGRIYATWMQAGDPDRGDSTDCVTDDAGLGFFANYNADIYMSISSSLNGSLWDARRNLTNSKSPQCDGTDALPCDHDNYPSPARFGMNTGASVVGATNWTAVPQAFEVRDILQSDYPDTGYYIDMQFINDIFPGISRYNDNVTWTNSPIKWFRLPCVAPIIEPRIFMPEAWQHPENWLKSGESFAHEAEILNLGNKELNVTNITANDIEGGTMWFTINTTSMNIPAASAGYASITLNPTLIDPGPGNAYGCEAWFIVASDDPNTPVDSFQIRTVITDTVMPVNYDLVTTGKGMQVGTLNNGSAANYPNTSGYLAFENDSTGLHEDCDSQEVYLYELSPIIMYDAGNGFWNGYYAFNDPEPDHNFVPVFSNVVKEEYCDSDSMSQYISGEFVTADSSLGMTKAWGAPSGNVSYVVEKWSIYSYDGQAHNGTRIAEWTDVDVPSDTSVNNAGTIGHDSNYIYVSGQEDNETGEGVSCELSDQRFYIQGLLGYYTNTEYNADPLVNNLGLEGAYINYAENLMTGAYDFIGDSLWAYLELNDFLPRNDLPWDDQRTLMDFGTFDIGPTDTIVIWIMHGALIGATNDGSDCGPLVDEARAWAIANREDFGVCGCCGAFTGGLVGNVDYDIDGKLNLTDITRLIDRVYVSKVELDCEGNGDIAEPLDGKINLADITRLIDRVYVSKTPTTNCL